MNYDLSEKEKQLQKALLTHLRDPSFQEHLDRFLRGDPGQRHGAAQWLLGSLGEMGYLGWAGPRERNSTALLAVQETLAAHCPSLFLTAEVSARLFGRLLTAFGTSELHREILEGIAQGRLVGSVAMAEGGMSLPGEAFETVIRRGDKGVEITGKKDYVINADLAHWLAVIGTPPEAPPQAHACGLVPTNSQGLEAGPPLPRMGWKGITLSTISFHGCAGPQEGFLGPWAGASLPQRLRQWEDQILTAAALGLSQRAFDEAVGFAKGHVREKKPIIAYQEVGFRLAEMLTLLQTSRLLAYRAAWAEETEEREAAVLIHCAKVLASETAEQIASGALQVMGAHGYCSQNAAEEAFRDSKYLEVAGTSVELSRMSIADRLLA